MAEETDGQETGAEATAGGVDPAAVALALGSASRNKADRFLEEQTALAMDQRHHLHRQFTALDLSIWEKRLGVLLRIATGFVGLAVAAGLALMIWDAAHADGLIIESFSVPPDLASRGLTGQVVATQVLDKLTAMQNDSRSLRSAQSYANNWGDDIQVQIPETGVSIGEVYRFLRGWLGHETRIDGEVYRTASGIAITARAGGDAGATYVGSESDLDSLVQKAAEHVYGSTQPYRYARYLTFMTTRFDEARAIFNQLIDSASPYEKAWAWHGLAVMAGNEGNLRADIDYDKRAMAAYPDFTAAYLIGSGAERNLGRREAALADNKKALQLLNRSSIPDIASYDVIPERLFNGAHAASDLGD